MGVKGRAELPPSWAPPGARSSPSAPETHPPARAGRGFRGLGVAGSRCELCAHLRADHPDSLGKLLPSCDLRCHSAP